MLVDCVTLLTTTAGTLLSMLQDRRRPVWLGTPCPARGTAAYSRAFIQRTGQSVAKWMGNADK